MSDPWRNKTYKIFHFEFLFNKIFTKYKLWSLMRLKYTARRTTLWGEQFPNSSKKKCKFSKEIREMEISLCLFSFRLLAVEGSLARAWYLFLIAWLTVSCLHQRFMLYEWSNNIDSKNWVCTRKSLLNKGAGGSGESARVFLHFIDFEYSWCGNIH